MKQPLRQSIIPYLDDFRSRKISGREIATALSVAESWVSKTLKDLKVTKVKKITREEAQQLRQGRLAHRVHAAKTMSIKDAAKACNVHPRTITRLLTTKE